ncbi:oligosaccharide flippase family protein [Vibrio sp. 10N.261.51.F12]|uniref:oligosaccharide flippase family protein n=1 Tax=Vibrio sp. 10N.261.51.F12 TaxID=3229679 RepID=UPI00354B7366
MNKKNTLYYILGEMIAKVVPFAFMPYLTRQLGADGYGDLALYHAWSVLALVFISYAQEAAIIRYIFYYGKRGLKHLLSVGYIYIGLMTVVLSIIALMLKDDFLLYVVLCSSSQAFLKVRLTEMQGLQRARDYMLVQVSFSLFSVIVTLMLFELLAQNPEVRVVAIILANMLALFFSFTLSRSICASTKNSKKNRFSLRKAFVYVNYIVVFCSPLIFNNLSSFIKGQFDRVLLSGSYNSAELGVYSVGYQFASILLVLTIAGYRAYEPYVYGLLKKSNFDFHSFKKKSLKYSPLCFLPFLLSLVLSEGFYTFIIGDGYNGVPSYVSLFLFAFGVNAIYFLYVPFLSFFGKTKVLMIINVLSMLVYVFLLFVLTNVSILYVPYATIMANVIMVIYVIKESNKVVKSNV